MKIMNNRKRKQNKNLKPSYCVFVEGKTEKTYLKEFKCYELNNKINMDIYSQLKSCDVLCSNKNSVDDVIKTLREAEQKGYDKVFYVFDKDVLLAQDNNTPKGKQKPSEKLKVMKEKLENTTILENSPCFELWLLLHFIFTTRSFNNCDDVMNELKKYDNSYKKGNAIYQEYMDKLEFAIKNAEKLDREETESKAQIYKIIKELLIKTNS
jgi:hypothetical protein